MQLPPEVLFQVFSQVEEPLDLYHASLVAKAWRATAVDPRLWEDFYWRYYRGGRSHKAKEEKMLIQRLTHRRHAAMRQWLKKVLSSSPSPDSPITSPPFLKSSVEVVNPMPKFYSLFVSRMNSDDKLLRDVRKHTTLRTGIFEDLLALVSLYGEMARDLLAALAATQQLNTGTVERFAKGGADHVKGRNRLRAIDVHASAAAGRAQPETPDCLALHDVARKILAHLQRRQAIRGVQGLVEQSEATASADITMTPRERVWERCVGIEDALLNVALFHSGETAEVKNYLDTLALFVWSNVQRLQKQRRDERHHDAQADSVEFVPQTTRQLMKDIGTTLRDLGFGLASDKGYHDISNCFLNASLVCPTQRKTTPLNFMAVICFVARRLGVASSLIDIDAPTTAIAVVMEDEEQPAAWSGDSNEQEWGRFFLRLGREHVNFILEVGGVRHSLTSPRDPALTAAQAERYLQPASPDMVLLRLSTTILSACQVQWWGVQGSPVANATAGNSPGEASSRATGSLQDGLALLCDYLSDGECPPPWPLFPALLRSSLAGLPSTRPQAPRIDSRALRQDAAGVVAWLCRLLPSSFFIGDQVNDMQVVRTCVGAGANWGPNRADLALLLEVSGSNVKRELARARRRATTWEDGVEERAGTDSNSEDDGNYSTLPRPSRALRRIATQVLAVDRLACNGMGGSGGLGPAERSPAALRLMDKSYPEKLRARYAIGTVFTHRVQGYLGIIAGRESICTGPEEWIAEHGVVSRC